MIPAGCKRSEISKFLRSKILKNGEKVKSITIIDPYFFKKVERNNTTEEIILDIFKNSNQLSGIEVSDGFSPLTSDENFNELEYIEVIVPKKHYKKDEKERKDKLEISIKNNNLGEFCKLKTVVIEDKFHDRFWIINESKAFIVGASINAMGGKHFYIQDDFLTSKDTVTLLCLYKNGHEKNNDNLEQICNYLENGKL